MDDSRDQKLQRLLHAIGAGADTDFAIQVLQANNWDLQLALNVILGDAAPEAPVAPIAPSAPSAPSAAPFDPGSPVAPPGLPYEGGFRTPVGFGPLVNDDVRAPMRTGFHETLLTDNAAEQARQDAAREKWRQQEEARRIAAEERARQAAEELHKKNMARQAEEQRLALEKEALERKKQKLQQEDKTAKASRDDDSDEDWDDIPIGQSMLLSDLSAQLAGKDPAPPPPAPPRDEEEEEFDVPPAPAVPLGDLASEAPPVPPVPAPPPELEPAPEVPEAPAVQSEPEPAKKVEDPVILSLRELRKKYREAQPAELAACLRTLSQCVGRVLSDPQEPKYQRINHEKFRTRVGLEGAVAVLEAIGFLQEGEFLVMEADYARTQGLRLRDAKAKMEVLLSDLERAGF
ncbi:unnamed protein product [Effrenium voratum]|nr:unnamed protein product [Effrenium voratum]